MGKFSTQKRFTLDDDIGRYEIGKTLPGHKFLEEIERDIVEPMTQAMLGDPVLHLMASQDFTDEQYFKVLGQFWNFERSVGALHATRLLGYKLGPNGEYQEVEYMEVRQIWEEYKHARLYEDAILRLGYLDSRWELHSHPFCQIFPDAMALLAWFQRLATYPIPVFAAAAHLATEAPFVPWFEVAGKHAVNPIVRGCFSAQIYEETEHANIGRYTVMKYVDTSEMQALIRWACRISVEYMGRFGKAFYDFVKTQDADKLDVVKRWRRGRRSY
jgi:hypothetical protein